MKGHLVLTLYLALVIPRGMVVMTLPSIQEVTFLYQALVLEGHCLKEVDGTLQSMKDLQIPVHIVLYRIPLQTHCFHLQVMVRPVFLDGMMTAKIF